MIKSTNSSLYGLIASIIIPLYHSYPILWSSIIPVYYQSLLTQYQLIDQYSIDVNQWMDIISDRIKILNDLIENKRLYQLCYHDISSIFDLFDQLLSLNTEQYIENPFSKAKRINHLKRKLIETPLQTNILHFYQSYYQNLSPAIVSPATVSSPAQQSVKQQQQTVKQPAQQHDDDQLYHQFFQHIQFYLLNNLTNVDDILDYIQQNQSFIIQLISLLATIINYTPFHILLQQNIMLIISQILKISVNNLTLFHSLCNETIKCFKMLIIYSLKTFKSIT